MGSEDQTQRADFIKQNDDRYQDMQSLVRSQERANDRLKLVEDLLAKHKLHRRLSLIILTVSLLALLATELHFSLTSSDTDAPSTPLL